MKSKYSLIIPLFAAAFISISAQKDGNKTIQLNKKNSSTPDTTVTKIPSVPPDFSKSFNTPFIKPDAGSSFSMPVLPNRGNNPKDTPAMKYKPFKMKKGIK